MNWFSRSVQDFGAKRNDRVFTEAMRRLTREMDAIIHRHAAAGILKSGATIKALVQAMHSTSAEAVDEILRGIGAMTEHAGKKRQRMLEQLTTSLEAHQSTAEGTIQFAIERIGLGSDFKHAKPMIWTSRRRLREAIDNFAEGWTAPAGKPWKERHPYVFEVLLLLIGAAIAVAFQPLAGWFLSSGSASN
jgi:hypothetical protein